MADHEAWYELEEWIPDERAIGGRGFWTVLNEINLPFRTASLGYAKTIFGRVVATGRRVRLVRVTRNVVPMADEQPQIGRGQEK